MARSLGEAEVRFQRSAVRWCAYTIAPWESVLTKCIGSATDGVVRNGKSTAGHQRYLCSHCRKTWQLQFTYTASQPGTHQKIIDMAMNGVGCRATARIMGVGLNTIFRHLKNSGRSR
ncbi:IS1-like element transposase [Escherichia coli]|uniref:IS1-like element transposase n=1 Tax=Escherichia coli TaxID=562 RepID=UPI00208FE533|nr:IS1-like element transposase [Escherichia coli]